MNSTLMKVLLGLSLLGLGGKVIIIKKFAGRGGVYDFSSPFLFLPIGAMLIVLGGLLLISAIKEFKKPKKPQVTKCPKCKETFNYNDTLDGKCPNCKDVDTIDIKEYYEKFPEEKRE